MACRLFGAKPLHEEINGLVSSSCTIPSKWSPIANRRTNHYQFTVANVKPYYTTLPIMDIQHIFDKHFTKRQHLSLAYPVPLSVIFDCVEWRIDIVESGCNCAIPSDPMHTMMTSSNGNICRVTGLLCGEFTGQFPLTKASNAGLGCFLWSSPESTAKRTIMRLVKWDAIVVIMTSL